MNVKFIPIQGRVLLEPMQAETKFGSIEVPEKFQEKSVEHCVVAIPRDTAECPVQVGQRVIINRFEGTDVKVEGKMYKLTAWKDILAIVE